MNRIIKIVILLIVMILSISFGMIVLFFDIHIAFKVLLVFLSFFLSIASFTFISEINKEYLKTVSVVKKDEPIKVKEVITKDKKRSLRCPRCYKPYDGDICFYCGYSKENNN